MAGSSMNPSYGPMGSVGGRRAQQTNLMDQMPSFIREKAQAKGPTSEELARRAGYGVSKGAGSSPGVARKVQMNRTLFRPGIVDVRPLDSFLTGDQEQDPLQQAAFYDASQQKLAADEQWARNNQPIDAMGNMLGGLDARIVQPGLRDANQMRGMASDLQGQGQNVGQPFDQAADRVLKDGETDLGEAYALARKATGDMEQAASGYSDSMAMDMSAMAAGIRQNMKQAEAQLTGPTPDGRLRTEAEIKQGRMQIRQMGEAQVQQALTPLVSQWNQMKASLKQAVGGMRMQEANLHLQGAQLRGQNEQTAAGIRATGESLRFENAKVVSTLYQVANQFEQGAQLAAAQLELQGFTQMAQLIQQNPRSLVSWFSTLLALESVGSARGSATAGQPTQAGQPQSSAGPKNQAKQPGAKKKTAGDYNRERTEQGKKKAEERRVAGVAKQKGSTMQKADPSVGEWGQGYPMSSERSAPKYDPTDPAFDPAAYRQGMADDGLFV